MPEFPVRRLDHVGLVATDLSALRAAWARLGFAPTEPKPLLGRDPATGASVPLGQESCHVVLDGGYVELTAVAAGVRNHLDPWRVRGPGLHILALGTADAPAERARQAAAGLAVTPVMHASRAIEYGERHGAAEFAWFMLDVAQSPELLVCTVEHRTPALVFQPTVQRQPNGATALESVLLVVADPVREAGRFHGLFGGEREATADGVRCVADGECLELVSPAAFAARYPGVERHAVPGAGAMTIRCRDLAALRARLAEAGVASHGDRRSAWVAPGAAGGVVVEFTGA